MAAPYLTSTNGVATDSSTSPAPVILDFVFRVGGSTERHRLSNIRGQVLFAASLKLCERSAFSSTEHSTASMLIPDAAKKKNRLNSIRDRGKFVRYWQEVLCHEVPSATTDRNSGV
ncbi:MAG: hypothetical protein HOO92_04060 [Methylococcaceae bacterium]|nr:hypothetical protein [Methylococcaceae bacterium]